MSSASVQKVVLSENDDLIKVLSQQGVQLANMPSEIWGISKGSANNYVGLFRFAENEKIVEISIVPKTFSKEGESLEVYFQRVAEAAALVNQCGLGRLLPNSIALLSNLSSAGRNLSPQNLIRARYDQMIGGISRFFRCTNERKFMRVFFFDQTLRSEIDFEQTLKDPVKANIHQIGYEPYKMDDLAEIAANALLSFSQQSERLQLEDVKQAAHLAAVSLFSEFPITVNHRWKYELFSRGLWQKYSYQPKNHAYWLLRDLLDLGAENYPGAVEIGALRATTAVSFFLNPISTYEVVVYADLIKQYGKDCVFCKPRKSRSLRTASTMTDVPLVSEPDFLIRSGDQIIVADAKWKILRQLDSGFFYDWSKLYRDKHFHQATNMRLFYPAVPALGQETESAILPLPYNCDVDIQEVNLSFALATVPNAAQV